MTQTDKLGKRVRMYREKLGLTQEELAINSGLGLELIRDIENSDTYPTIGQIVKLSRALGQRTGTFMDDQFVKDPVIVRNAERTEESSSHRSETHYHYFPLGKGKTDRHMEPLFIRIEVDTDESLSSHEGEEFIVVVSGKVRLIYGIETHILKPGDSMYYNALVPHNTGAIDGPAEIYAVIYTPI